MVIITIHWPHCTNYWKMILMKPLHFIKSPRTVRRTRAAKMRTKLIRSSHKIKARWLRVRQQIHKSERIMNIEQLVVKHAHRWRNRKMMTLKLWMRAVENKNQLSRLSNDKQRQWVSAKALMMSQQLIYSKYHRIT